MSYDVVFVFKIKHQVKILELNYCLLMKLLSILINVILLKIHIYLSVSK